jgi:hypothetical protein
MGVTVNHWLVEFDPLMRSQYAQCRFTLWQDGLCILGNKPLKLQLEFSQKNIALIWFQSVHGRTRACHARRRGSLPLGTAKLMRD